MEKSDVFEQNLRRWSKFSPKDSPLVERLECTKTKLSTNSNGDPNVEFEIGGLFYSVHAKEDAVAEAKQWFESLNLRKINVIFVYGIGLGYAYDAAEGWLRQSEKNQIVFIEDNLEMIHRFLETERASRFLHDKQAWLEYLDWRGSTENFFKITTEALCLFEFHFEPLPFQATHFEPQSKNIHARISFWMMIHRGIEAEHVTHGKMFYTNFYSNILDLPFSYRASELFGEFHGIPAIICGAGPSLDKNLALLETLENKALIFAGATALNAVNSNGFLPHFGLGIDPNPHQATRIIANKAYEVPFLYRHRINRDAFEVIHGDKIYVTGSSGYEISDWFEKELGISGLSVNEGCNVVNFNLSVAYEMGCNPLILVGVDLAYSERHSYQSGVKNHPTNILKSDFATKHPSDELVVQDDIYGNPVYTLWKWVAESSWYSQFSLIYSNALLINATEGGIGMERIPNKPLKEVVDHLFTRNFDFLIYRHGEIQNAAMPSSVTVERIVQLIQEIRESVSRCKTYLQNIKNESVKLRIAVDNGLTHSNDSLEELEDWKKLIKETAFATILSSYNKAFLSLASRQLLQNDNDVTSEPNQVLMRKLGIHEQRYAFLLDVAITHENTIQEVLARHEKDQIGEEVKELETNGRTGLVGGEQYTYTKEEFFLKDPELTLSFCEKLNSNPISNGTGRDLIRYPSGAIKIEHYLLEGQFHGPSTFFSETGSILARNWYVKGVLQGKSLFYYHSGPLHSLRRFRDGVSDGLQEYYYPNGGLKSSLGYSKGQLHGDVWLYYPNGKLKRELHFIHGKHHGMERMWNSKGVLTIEVEYQNDLPTGKAKTWHENGQLAQEISYDTKGNPHQTLRWDIKGVPIAEHRDEAPDYFDQIAIQANLLTESLNTVNDQLQKVSNAMKTDDRAATQMQKDFDTLHELMEKLRTINKNLLFESGMQGENGEEAIWKTPTIEREMQKKLEGLTERFSHGLKHMQDMVDGIVSDEQKKIKDSDKDNKQQK